MGADCVNYRADSDPGSGQAGYQPDLVWHSGGGEFANYRDGVHAKFGVYPERVVDVQALAGDSVDNVPGAPGIGIKTAALLINEYGDLDSLLERAGEIKQPKRRETLLNNVDQIRLSRQLVQLDCNTPLDFTIDDLEIRDPDPEQLLGFLSDMEFRTLTKRVAERFGKEMPQIIDVAPSKSAGQSASVSVADIAFNP